MSSKKLSFLWPHEEDSLEEALFEFGMARTEEYAQEWYLAILERLPVKRAVDSPEPCGDYTPAFMIHGSPCLNCDADAASH